MFQKNGRDKNTGSRRFYLVFLLLIFNNITVASDEIVYLEQGWDKQQRTEFYRTPQGSYLIPLSWYFALEQPESKKLFSNTKHIKKYNLIIYSAQEMKNMLHEVGYRDIRVDYYKAFRVPFKGYIVPKGMIVKAVKNGGQESGVRSQ